MAEPATDLPLPDLPVRPTLRPGWYVVRRDADTLQVGIDPPHRVVVSDTPGIRALLRALRTGCRPERLAPEAVACLSALLAADLVVDADVPALDAAQFGASARPRVRSRRSGLVGVQCAGPLRALAERAVIGAGLAVLGTPDATGPAAPAPPNATPAVWLLVHEGEPARERLDPLVRDGIAHLLVTSAEDRVEVGPFVVPGRTACLRCVDAQRAVADPRRRLVVEQVTRAVEAGATVPRDHALWGWALGWAARDLARHAEGDRPSTWSTSFVIDAAAAPHEQRWARHPHCGCAWQQEERVS